MRRGFNFYETSQYIRSFNINILISSIAIAINTCSIVWSISYNPNIMPMTDFSYLVMATDLPDFVSFRSQWNRPRKIGCVPYNFTFMPYTHFRIH